MRILDASAGSGKTYRLSLEYLLLLLTNPQLKLKNILAITFTNDATNEMKDRILTYLKLLSLNDTTTSQTVKDYDTTGTLAQLSDRELSAVADKRIKEIFADYLDFNVLTIDSFINAIAASSLVEIGLPPDYDIVMNTERCIKQVVGDVLSQLNSNSSNSKLFDDFLQSYLRIEKIKSWNPKKSILENIKYLNDCESITGKRFISRNLSVADIEKKLKKVHKSFADTCSKTNLSESIMKKVSEDRLEEITEKQLESLPQEVKKVLKEYFETLSSMRLNSYISIFEFIRDELERFKKEHRVVFISDLNIKINEYLKNGVVPEVYFMLGDRIIHYLIDEFQDTSEPQWRNLFYLIENSLASGGTFFYVGDKKQSLYRFRGGEARLFDKAGSEFAVEKKELVRLTKNYRSRRNIVEFNNKVFSLENLRKLSEDEDILSYYKNSQQEVHRQKDSEGGYVCVRKLSFATKDEVETVFREKLLELLVKVCQNYNYKDVGILVRKNEFASKITSWLLGAGYPVISDMTLSIRSNHLINEIISFLRFLSSPTDNLSFASFISGEIFAAGTQLKHKDIMDFLEKNRKSQSPLYLIFEENYREISGEKIKKYLEFAGYISPYEIVSSFLKDYNVFEHFSSSEGFFMQLLEILNSDEFNNSLGDFLEYWQEGDEESFQVILSDTIDAIKVSTIHKAKGLSYPVVIVPFLPVSRTDNKFVVESDTLDLRYIKTKYLKFSENLARIYQENSCKELLDDLNSLYVALTRAEDELYLFMLETRQLKNPFMVLFDECEITPARIKPLKKETPKQIPALSIGKITKTSQSDLLQPKESDIQIYTDPSRFVRIKRGEFIHKVLSRINKFDTKESTIDEAINSTIAEGDYPDALSEIKKTIFNFLTNVEVSKWFLKEGLNEFQVVDSDGAILRVDRIVYEDDKVTVVEYKTGEEYSEIHLAQLRYYMKIISEIYPDKKIEGYLAYVEDGKVIKL